MTRVTIGDDHRRQLRFALRFRHVALLVRGLRTPIPGILRGYDDVVVVVVVVGGNGRVAAVVC